MTKRVLVYGSLLAIGLAALKTLEAVYFRRQWSVDMLVGAAGVVFLGVGVGIGWVILRARSAAQPLPAKAPAQADSLPVHLPPPGAVAPFTLLDTLSDREREVLALLALGYTNAQLAERLFVSPNTVKTHLQHIYDKLGVPNRTAAVSTARQLGIIAPQTQNHPNG